MNNEQSLAVFHRAFEAASSAIRENQKLSDRIRNNWGPEYRVESNMIDNERSNPASLTTEKNR